MAGRASGKSGKQSKAAANKEFFEALEMFEQERGIPVDYMIDKIKAAITVAVKNNNGGNDDIVVNISPEKNAFEVFLHKTVVEEIKDKNREMLIDEAQRYDSRAVIGDIVSIPLETKEFGRIAAMTAKHVIRQGIREVERGQVMQELQSRNQEIVSASVERIDPRSGAAILRIGKFEVPLPKSEQVAGEILREGDIVKVYVVDIKDGDRGPRATVSRTHPGLVKRLFETEVPEIYDGTVEIKAVSREAGSRTKLAVISHDENVDPVGACIGPRSSRVSGIVDELGGEKIDIIKYSDDPTEFISKALSPANVISVEIDDAQQPRTCRVRVPDSQLSLAIGNKGQNARLAARLTGWKIDIRAESDDSEIPEDESGSEE